MLRYYKQLKYIHHLLLSVLKVVYVKKIVKKTF